LRACLVLIAFMEMSLLIVVLIENWVHHCAVVHHRGIVFTLVNLCITFDVANTTMWRHGIPSVDQGIIICKGTQDLSNHLVGDTRWSRCDRHQVGGHRWKHTKLSNSGQGNTETEKDWRVHWVCWYINSCETKCVICLLPKMHTCDTDTINCKKDKMWYNDCSENKICIFHQRFNKILIF
jgi:hypothetical protein